MRRGLWLAMLAWPLGCGHGAIVVVRHAEKGSGSGNVSLTPAGQRRARALVDVIRGPVRAVYATDWCRTIQTAEPVARAAGVPILVQPQSYPSAGHADCRPAIVSPLEMLPTELDTPEELAAHLRERGDEGVVLVVGHSSTVDDLVAGVGGGTVDELSEGTFDRLFLVTRSEGSDAGRLFVVRYGEPSP